MTLSPQSLWRASLLLFLVISHSGEAKVLTEVQSGPLYRVMNYPLSISCNVSGFSNPDAVQDFEFSIYKSDRPSRPIQIISTKDPYYSYAVYSSRVNNHDIAVERVSPTSVLFKINNITEFDEGDFECHVVNSESAYGYEGTWAGKTTVIVIHNSLAVSTPDTTSLSHNVGEAITLTCQASCYTIQHTHLSVTWSLLRDGEHHARPIISLDRDFTLSPGQGFEERYESGLIGLEKVGEATYKLKMSQLEPSDQGNIYCEAREWIQEPDRSWYAIAKEVTGAIALKVKPKEVAPSEGTLTVRIAGPQTTLLEGQEMSLSCNLDTRNPRERFFSVAWLQDGTELARIGPTGALTVGPEYSGRDSGGELRVIRIGDTDHRLVLQPVRAQDQGEYRCRAWPQDRGTDGTFIQGAAQDSTAQLVTISATASALSVEMQSASVTVEEGDRLQLTCKVKGAKGRLSITWQHRSAPMKSIGNVISINQEGVMELGSEFAQRSLKATHPTPDTFTLELNEVTPADGGVHLCTVSEWSIETDGTLQKTLSQTKSSNVSVSPAEALLEVHLISRNNIVTVGEQTRLLCRVRGPRLPVTVTWSLQRKGTSSPDNILTLSRNGNITWHGDQVRYQLKTEISTTNPKPEVKHTLLLIGASHREAGTYQCDVSVFMRGIHRKLRASNRLAVEVNDPVSKLSLRASNPVVKGNINTDIEIKCHIAERTSDSSRFAVTWWIQHHTGSNQTILSSDRDAVLRFGLEAESGTWQRFGMKRSEGQSIDLTIRQARVGDSGTYHCVVVEWLQDPRGEWYELSPAHGAIDVQIVEPANDLRVDKTEMQLMAREAEEVDLSCTLTSGGANPSFRFTLTWFYVAPGAPDGTKVLLVELDHSGLLTYPVGLRSLQERLRLSRPAHTSFHLGIQRADESDSGTYRCGVKQYQLNQGIWQLKAEDHSGPITLSVKPTEGNLSMLKKDVELNVTASQKFNVCCDITSRSSRSSAFQVTWFWKKETGSEKLPIYTSYRDATLQDRSDKRGRLRFDHPAPDRFELTILGSVAADSGLYLCEVEEWLLSSSHGWRRVAVETSGEVTVTVYAGANDYVRVDKTEMQLMAREAEEVDLSCTLTSGGANPSFRFTLTWFYVAPGAPDGTKVLLVELDHSGLLTYSKNQELRSLQERLRLSRPTHTSFHLGIQRADETDSGTYRCGVEQYQLNQGIWQLKAEDHSGPITLSVKPTEGNLSMLKKDVELNVTASQKFNICCDITSRSSRSSAFQVTWFWKKETGSEKLPIYTSYRDATLQDRSDKRGRLRFDHPAPDRFELTILGSVAADSGLYLCEVEEWLLSSSHGWRRVAVETSGEVTVTVYAGGAGSGCPLGMILGVLTSVIVCLLVVVVLLTLKICRGQVSGAKQSHSLWAEGHPLKAQPEPEPEPELDE